MFISLNEDEQYFDYEFEAIDHFEMYGYWEGRRYFYHPYEIEGGTGREPGHGEGEEGVALAPYSIDGLSIEYIENGETEDSYIFIGRESLRRQ